MTYIINIWKSSYGSGVACIWRGTDRKQFLKEIQKAVQKYGAVKNIARWVNYGNYEIFSFTDSARAYYSWLDFEFSKKPISAKYVKIGKGGIIDG